MSVTPTTNWAVVEECLDEAEFLWASRERALDAHNQNMERVGTWIEERLLGALDGILVAGDAAIDLLATALDGVPSRASVAAYLLASLNCQAAADVLVRVLSTASQLLLIRRGLELAASDLFLRRLQQAVGNAPPRVLALMTDVRAYQGVDGSDKIKALWATADEDVQAATVRLARNSPKDVASYVASLGLEMEQPEIRIEAMELGLMVGVDKAWNVALAIVDKHEPGFGRAAIAVAALGAEREHERLVSAVSLKDLQRDALFAMGFAGTAIAADACLAAAKTGPSGKISADSFCVITGLDLDKEQMVLPEPSLPDQPVPFEADDLDADLVPKVDEELPIPDLASVARWWADNRKRFPAKERFVYGQPWSLPLLHKQLTSGPTRRRHGWAFEVAVRTQGAHRIQTRAFMATQRSQIAKLGERLPMLQSRADRWPRR
jgi:uncharacterized protein (TIGR02270 family)